MVTVPGKPGLIGINMKTLLLAAIAIVAVLVVAGLYLLMRYLLLD